jgi:integral membrane protein|tara:strand:- start:731 stop:1033 length:303 start_codon:yes stop_codon:yes gene_type:complete
MKSLVSFIGYLEGFSFLLLMGVAMPMKYIGGDASMVSLVGSLHGGLFVAYIGLLFLGVGKHWNFTALIHGFIAAVVPAGPFLFEGMLISGEYDLETKSTP